MKRIVINIGLILLMVSGSSARIITGTVYDATTGEALAGVTIQVKGTIMGQFTDINGNFSLNVPDEKKTLVFSSVGYVTQEIEVADSNPLKIFMQQEMVGIDEIVVTGYVSEKKKDVIGSVAVVNMGDINSSSGNYSSGNSSQLSGRVAGVSVRGAASPRNYSNAGTPHYNNFSIADANNEGYASTTENGYKSPLREPLSTFSVDVDAASYSNVRRFITQGQKPVPDAVRIEEMINYFTYDYPQPTDGHPFSIIYELGECPWNKKNMLLHIGLQGEKMAKSEVPPSNLVFLLDVSGSMDEPNKLPLLIKAMKMLTAQLREEDRVAIVVYAGSSGMVLPSTSGENKDRIYEALERLHAGGSTAGAAGLNLAYHIAEENFMADGNNRIILATDGDFNVGPSSNADMERMIEHYRNKGIFISVAGFGMGNYKDDKMEIIADKGNGNYAYIDNLMEAKKVFVNEFSSTLYTIAKDVKIQIEFNPAYVKEYRLVGYENRLLNEEDFENDKKDAGEMGAGHTVTALYEIVPAKNEEDKVLRLKYQQPEIITDEAYQNELATIKFRYKKPDGDKSILITKTIPKVALSLDETSDNFRFSASVAGFGMLLRNSEYKGSVNYEQVLTMARGSKGNDDDGYRAEFIRLIEMAENDMALNDPGY